MKKIILIMVCLLILSGCATKQLETPQDQVSNAVDALEGKVSDEQLQEVKDVQEKFNEMQESSEDETVQEEEQTPQEEPQAEAESSQLPSDVTLNENEYFFKVNDEVKVDGLTVKVSSIESGPLVKVMVGSTPIELIETKSDEIAEGLVISLQKFHFRLKDSPENYVVLKLTPFELNADEYLITEKESVTLNGTIITLNEARTDGAIYVKISNSRYSNEKVAAGKTETFDNIEVSPVKTFTKDNTRPNYAIVRLVLKS